MNRLKLGLAACAAAASLAASGGTAVAQDIEVAEPTIAVACDDVNACVNHVFATADRTIVAVQRLYEATAERYVCDAHWILTGQTCP